MIERGKLAVLIGIESSNLFGCSERKASRSARARTWTAASAPSSGSAFARMFIAHWVDNAFGRRGAGGRREGRLHQRAQPLQTGHYFRTAPCPERGQGEEVTPLNLGHLDVPAQLLPRRAAAAQHEPIPSYPPGRQCNAKGLTNLGRYLVRRLIANHMLIEVDHMSERARLAVLRIAEAHGYPLVSSHTDTGGHWTPSDLRRLYTAGRVRHGDPVRREGALGQDPPLPAVPGPRPPLRRRAGYRHRRLQRAARPPGRREQQPAPLPVPSGRRPFRARAHR